MSECKCNLRTRLVGDGCQYCNPAMHAEVLSQQVEDLESEVARLRLTDEEREAVEWAIYEGPLRSQAEGAEERAATLRNLLERLRT